MRKGTPITAAERERLAADLTPRYEQGASIRALAEESGRSYGAVRRVLLDAGVVLRGKGGSARGDRRPTVRVTSAVSRP